MTLQPPPIRRLEKPVALVYVLSALVHVIRSTPSAFLMLFTKVDGKSYDASLCLSFYRYLTLLYCTCTRLHPSEEITWIRKDSLTSDHTPSELYLPETTLDALWQHIYIYMREITMSRNVL